MMTWRKSSFSSNASNCVEIAWRKSSFSGNTSNCVEVGFPGGVAVRDSKNTAGPTLSYPTTAWSTFLRALP